MNPVSHMARASVRFALPGFLIARDDAGRMGFTRLHNLGHVTPKAGIASQLQFAAKHRHLPEHHAIFMAKAKALRKFGTWFGKL